MGVDAIDQTIYPSVLGMTKCSIAFEVEYRVKSPNFLYYMFFEIWIFLKFLKFWKFWNFELKLKKKYYRILNFFENFRNLEIFWNFEIVSIFQLVIIKYTILYQIYEYVQCFCP
jgi:hypothetical protein